VPKNEVVCCEVQTHFVSFLLARFTENSGRIFPIYESKIKTVCCKVQTHFGSPLTCEVCEKSSERIFLIFLSKNKAVYHWVQMNFVSFLHASFIKNILGAFF